jgi:hypothetical protein
MAAATKAARHPHAAVVSRSVNTCQIASHLRQRQTTMDLRTVVFTSSEPHTGHRLTVWFGMAGEGISIEWQRQLSSVAGTCVTEDEATEVEREGDRSAGNSFSKRCARMELVRGPSRVHRRMDWTPTGRRSHPGGCRGRDSGAAASVDRRCSESPGTHGVRRSRRTDKSPQSSHRMYRKWSVRETSRPATPKQLAQATWRRSRSVTASLWSKNVWWGAKTDYTPGRRSRQGAPGHEPCPRPPR